VTAVHATDVALQIHWGYGSSMEHSALSYLRDAGPDPGGSETSEVLREVIARTGLGK
jgi:alkylation response protein AidB-like acyl-CoA dehydrogenase